MTTRNDGRTDSAHRVVDSTTLPQRAEEQARATGDQDLAALSPERGTTLRLHLVELATEKLRVHQIELEMQNEELRRAQEKLELIFDRVPAYIAYLDSNLNILHVNRRQAEWWGYSKEQAVGKNYEEVAPPGSYEKNSHPTSGRLWSAGRP